MEKNVSASVINRLPRYYRYLGELLSSGVERISSKELSEKLCFCDNPTLNLILTRYKDICKTSNIQFYIDIRKNTVSFINIEDIAALFGNLLENAVEATTGIDDSFIELSVKYNESGQLIISMINSCNLIPVQTSSGDYISRKKRRLQKKKG